MNSVLNRLDIPNKDCIRGNITLLPELDGAKIQWKSSKPDVISDEKIGEKAAGVVVSGGAWKHRTTAHTKTNEN